MAALREVPFLLGLLLAATQAADALRHGHSGAQSAGRGRWDLVSAMQDQPPGAYRALMDPVAQAMSLAYELSNGPMRNLDLPEDAPFTCPGCGNWERLTSLDDDPQLGVHSFVFVNNETKQAILAFRGACMETKKRTCRGDVCFLIRHQTYGHVTNSLFGDEGKQQCAFLDQAKTRYLIQAKERVTLLQKELPGYNILLVGHSLGAYLAAYVAAQMPGEVQALAFSPLAVGRAMMGLNMTKEQLDAQPSKGDILSICDPYDCTLYSMAVDIARRGTLTCFYDEWVRSQVPKSCYGIKDMVRDRHLDSSDWQKVKNCIIKSHDYQRYVNLTKMTTGGGPLLPTCSEDLSVLSDRVTQSVRFAQKKKLGPYRLADDDAEGIRGKGEEPLAVHGSHSM
mmetsp:Transcript_53144/g.154668  ORF Transcript_53144/g.154668 Transcript_53144/m.154668 type:complete len:395 (+) Transcript_53144:92-1276(+)